MLGLAGGYLLDLKYWSTCNPRAYLNRITALTYEIFISVQHLGGSILPLKSTRLEYPAFALERIVVFPRAESSQPHWQVPGPPNHDFPRALGANLGAPYPGAKQELARFGAHHGGITATLASPRNTTRIRCMERLGGPTTRSEQGNGIWRGRS